MVSHFEIYAKLYLLIQFFSATKEEIIEYCIYNLPYTYLPKIHVQKEPLPKLPNGKYNKHLMLRLKGLSSG